MPRCGCQDACSCLIVAGDGISVEGIGTLERPYEITSESSDLVGRIEFTDEGNVDFTVTGVGTLNDPTTVFADAVLAVTDLTDVGDDTPVEGDVLVWRIDHWEFEQQTGGSGVPPGGTTGQVLTKNTNTDGDAGWKTPASGGGVVEPTYAAARSSTAGTSLTTATSTKLNMETVIREDGITWDTTNLGFVAPVDGWYDIKAAVQFAANATGYRLFTIAVNNTAVATTTDTGMTASGGQSLTLSKEVFLTAGQWVSVFGYQNSGANLATTANPVYNYLTISKVPAQAPGGGGVVVERPVVASFRQTALVSVAQGAVQIVPWDTVDFNEGFGAVVGGVITIPSDGYYQVNVKVNWESNSTGYRQVRIGVSGTSATAGIFTCTPNSGTAGVTEGYGRLLKLVAGDQLTVQVNHNVAATLSVGNAANYNSIDIAKLPQSFSGSAVSTYGERNYASSRTTSTATSIPNAVATAVPFEVSLYEDGIPWNGTDFVIPVAGYYKVDATLSYAFNATGSRYIMLWINGGQKLSMASATSSGTTTVNTSDTVKLAAGDTVSIRAYHTAGAALTIGNNLNYNRITIAKVPAPVINGAAASGVWGASPLNIYGSGNDKMGREIYIDSAGQLRSAPSVFDFADSGFTAATPISSYPQGFSILTFNTAANTDWPVPAMPGQVNTMRRNSYGVQHFFVEKDGAVANQAFYYRITYGGTPGTWGPWMPLVTNGGAWVDCKAEVRFCTDVSSAANVGQVIYDARYTKIGKTVFFRGYGLISTAAVVNFALLLPPSAGVPYNTTTQVGPPQAIISGGDAVLGGWFLSVDRIINIIGASGAYSDSVANEQYRWNLTYEVL